MVKILAAFDHSISGINSADEEGWAPLHSASSSGNVEIVKILLDRGWIILFLLKLLAPNSELLAKNNIPMNRS